jgi:hypothetical protein
VLIARSEARAGGPRLSCVAAADAPIWWGRRRRPKNSEFEGRSALWTVVDKVPLTRG